MTVFTPTRSGKKFDLGSSRSTYKLCLKPDCLRTCSARESINDSSLTKCCRDSGWSLTEVETASLGSDKACRTKSVVRLIMFKMAQE